MNTGVGCHFLLQTPWGGCQIFSVVHSLTIKNPSHFLQRHGWDKNITNLHSWTEHEYGRRQLTDGQHFSFSLTCRKCWATCGQSPQSSTQTWTHPVQKVPSWGPHRASSRALACSSISPRYWRSGTSQAALVVKNHLPVQENEGCRFDPWVRMIPWRRKWQPTPVFMPGKSQGQRSLAGYRLQSMGFQKVGHD